ncbi:hypothetical protein AAFP35_18080 [Gordonia sp. CPCC 206044]|uniref:hypothetical protein n=1 Tax=Gordonia sp. CPCC 206044 TaxID=3140793 RepID=UPI003AF34B3E
MPDLDINHFALSAVEALDHVTQQLESTADADAAGEMRAILGASLITYLAGGMTRSGLMTAVGWGLNHLQNLDLLDGPGSDAAIVASFLACTALTEDNLAQTVRIDLDQKGALAESVIHAIRNRPHGDTC